MGKVVVWLAVGLLVGVGLTFTLQRFLVPGADPAASAGGDAEDDLAVTEVYPASFRVDEAGVDPAMSSEPARLAGGTLSSRESPGVGKLPHPEPVWSGTAETQARHPSPPDPTPGMLIEEAVALAEAAFAGGNARRGTQLLRGIFHQARDWSDVDLTAEARKLLDLDDDPKARRDYLRYLQRRGVGGTAFQEQLSRANILAASEDADAVKRAWDAITIAYEVAIDPTDRRKVVALLDPYIERMVFSKRFTPILKVHTVKTGDRLWNIANRFGTTVDALRRINGLKDDVIRPRSRLLALAGRVRVFVDKSDFCLWLTVDDRVFLERSIGTGKENRTPLGPFTVRVRQKDPTWYPAGGAPIPPGDPRNVLGTRWLGFADTDKHFGFGIHGTDDPADIRRESSAGCIRLLTKDMELVYDFVPRGASVTIQE